MRLHQLLLLGTIAFAPAPALAAPAYTITDLGTLGGDFSRGYGINASGQVTGSSITASGAEHAFLWDPVIGMFDLNDLIAPGLGWSILWEGKAINDAGQITGNGFIDFQGHPFLLTPVTEVPEPGTLALMGAGVIGLGLLRRRKGRHNAGAQAR